MEVSFSLRQIATAHDGPIYRVKNQITSATNASPSVFVFKTATQTFSHYASVADMDTYPDSYAAAVAAVAAFYRLTEVTRDWDTVAERNADVDLSRARVQALASDLSQLADTLTFDTTTVITGA